MCSSCVILFGISITSTKYWLPSTIWRFLSELVLLLPNTDRIQQFEDFCQILFYFYQILTAFNNLKIFVRACSTSTKYWPHSTIWRFLSEFFFYQILTALESNNIEVYVLYIPWILRINLYKPTNPKDELF